MRRGWGDNVTLSGKRSNGSVRPVQRGQAATFTRRWQAAEPEMACQRWRFMVFQEGTTYTFSQILKLNSETEEILVDLGYRFRSAPLELEIAEDPRLAPQLEADAGAVTLRAADQRSCVPGVLRDAAVVCCARPFQIQDEHCVCDLGRVADRDGGYLPRGRSQQDDIKREGARLSWANS